MNAARFSIGIDLGTTNSALAYAPLNGDAAPERLLIQQWETPETLVEVPMLSSPSDASRRTSGSTFCPTVPGGGSFKQPGGSTRTAGRMGGMTDAARQERTISGSALARQSRKIIQNRLALRGEESVSVGHRRQPPPGQSGEPTHAHLHHRQ